MSVNMPTEYSDDTEVIVRNATSANPSSLGHGSRDAYYLLSLGSILTAVALVLFVSTSLAGVASMTIFTNTGIRTVLVKSVEDVNPRTVQPAQVPLGILAPGYTLLVATILLHAIKSILFSCPTLAIPGTYPLLSLRPCATRWALYGDFPTSCKL